MIIFLKIILATLVIISFLAVWRLESKWRIVITPFMFLMYFELIRILPAFFVADNIGIANDLFPLLVALTGYFFLLFGFVSAYFAKPNSSKRVLHFHAIQKYDNCSRSNKVDAGAILLLSFFLTGLGLFFYQGLPATINSVLGLLGGAGDELARMVTSQRLELTKGAYFGSAYRGQGLIRTVLEIGWTLVCCYTLLNAVNRKTSRGWMVFGLSIFLAWLFVAGDGTRGPYLHLLIVVIAAYSFYRALSVRFVFIAGFAIIVLAILLSSYSGKMFFILADPSRSFFSEAFSRIFSRIFLGNALNDVRIIELINSGEWEVRLGANHIRNFITSIPGIRYGKPLGYDLFIHLNPGSSRTTFASGTYLSHVFVDFAWFGIIFLNFIAGCFVGLIQRSIFLLKKSLWSISIAATLAFYAARVVSVGFNGVISNFVIILFLCICFYFFRSFMRIYYSSQKKRSVVHSQPDASLA